LRQRRRGECIDRVPSTTAGEVGQMMVIALWVLLNAYSDYVHINIMLMLMLMLMLIALGSVRHIITSHYSGVPELRENVHPPIKYRTVRQLVIAFCTQNLTIHTHPIEFVVSCLSLELSLTPSAFVIFVADIRMVLQQHSLTSVATPL
jgi:hypothetical protein